MQTIRFLVLLLLLLTFRDSYAQTDVVVVIVSLANEIDRISSEELKAIYFGEMRVWNNRSVIIPLDLGESDPGRELFTRKIMKSTIIDLQFYWVKQIFSGKGTPPLVQSSDQQVKAYIASHPGAIGYIHTKSLDTTVKALLIDGRSMIE